jgi:hypothetical protein
MKCEYKYCKSKNTEEELIKIKTKNYHQKCYQEIQNKQKICELYYSNICKTVVYSQLVKTVDNIVNFKLIDSNYLLYIVEYIIRNKKIIHSPLGLHYYINDTRIMKEYTQKLLAQKIKAMDTVSSGKDNITFDYQREDETKWDNIVKKG